MIFVCLGITCGFLTYFYVVKRKQFTMTGRGFNLMAFASALLMTGLILIMKA